MRFQARCLCNAPRTVAARPVLMDAARRRSSAGSDPTGTARIRKRWSRDLDARWNTVKRLLPGALAQRTNPVNMISHSVLTGAHDPVQQFQAWLDEAMRQIVVGINGSWLLPYVRQASDVGALHARSTVSNTEASPQSGAVDRTHLLQSLAITELQGIVEAVSQQLVRAFASALLARQSAATMAGTMRALIDAVGVRRGHALVGFMAVKAHATATLDGFRAAGVQRVGLKPERAPAPPVIADAKSKKGTIAVLTAEDDRVCPVCEEIAADGPYYVDEAEALIPAHPNCRCAFVPADEEEYRETFGEDAFDPDEPRDKGGKWTAGGKTADIATLKSSQPASETKKSRVQYYRSMMQAGAALTPINVVHVKSTGENRVIDGHHRLLAAKAEKLKSVKVKVVARVDTPKEATEYYRAMRYGMDSVTHIASGVMITADDTGRTLFVRRSGSGDQKGTWCFPGGAVEPGETVEQAAARETREEIGYDPSSDLEQGHRQEWNGVDFTTYLHTADREFRPHLNGEHDAYKWALVEQAPEPLHPGVERTLDEMDRALRMRDDGTWNEGDHPRDKDGKFAEKGGGGSVQKSHAELLKSWLQKDPAFKSSKGDNWQIEPMMNGGYELSVKNLGHWENPPDAHNEEDYDWQVPTSETSKNIKEITSKFAAEHGMNVSVNGGEKNWTYFLLTPKSAEKNGGDKSKSTTTYEDKLNNVGTDVGHVADLEKKADGTDSGYDEITVPANHSHSVQASLDKHGLEYDKLASSGSIHTYIVKGEKTSAAPTSAAPPPAHPAAQHLGSVKGNSAERVAWRKQLLASKSASEKQLLQEKVVASFWKQHDALAKSGKLEAAADIRGKLQKYAKSYGMKDPLAEPAVPSKPTPAPAPKANKYDVNTPQGNFAQALENESIPHQTGTFGPSSPHAGHPYVAFGSATDNQKDMVKQIAKYHPEMSPIPESATIYTTKSALAAPKPAEPQPVHTTSAHAMAAELMQKYGKHSNVEENPDYWKISTSTAHKEQLAEIAKKYPDAKLIPNMQSTYMVRKTSAAKPALAIAPVPSGAALDFGQLKKVGDQKGSNPGGVYEDQHGNQYYVKTMDEAHSKNEMLAAKLYALANAHGQTSTFGKTLDYVPVKPDGDTHYVATRFEKLDKANVSELNPYEKKSAQESFAVHAWLANWDAAGTGGDNQGVKSGVVKTLDVGGALEYRAKGSPKGDLFGTSVTEFDTLRSHAKNPDAFKLYGSMSDEQIKQSVAQLKNISTQEIHATVTSVYGEGQKATALSNKLIIRRDDLLKRAENIGKKAAPPADDLSHLSEEEERLHWLSKTTGQKNNSYHLGLNGEVSQSKLDKLAKMGVTPAELGFIRAFTGPVSHVNKEMREGVMNDHVFAFKHIMNDALAKFPVYDGDKVWRKISLDEKQQALYEPGKIVHWQAFSSTSKNSNTWNGNTHFTIHNPKSGRDVQFISENPSEAEVIMPADTYYRVLSKKVEYGTTHIELEEVLPPGKKHKQKKVA